MTLRPSVKILLDARRDLLVRLDRTRDRWDDAVRRDFEARYIAPLDSATTHACKAIEQLDELMSRARRDVADDLDRAEHA